MKRILLAVYMLLTAGLMQAQPYEKKGKDILDAVAKKTAAYKTMKIEFSYLLQNKEGKATGAAKEGVILIKGDKYHLTIPGQTLICDSKTVWTYLKDAQEVQINTYDPNNEDALNPKKILTSYSATHKPKFIKEDKVGTKPVYLIDLEPLKGRSYYRIRLKIDKASNDLISSTIYQKSGDQFIYTIKKMTPDAPIADTKFTFNKAEFPGVEMIDMR